MYMTKGGWEVQESSAKKFMRPKSSSSVGTRPRPKTIHLSEVDSGASGTETPRHGALRRSDSQTSSTSLARSYGKRGSSNTLYSETRRSRPASSYDRRSRPRDLSTSRLEVRSSRRDSYMGSQESLAHRHNSTSSLLDGPGSLPPGLISRRHRGFDDGASDISSVASSNMDYSGLRLYKQPTAKSNRSIILNAVEYCVFPGVVNRDAKMKVLEEINRSESKHFLVMFRDAGCQFRALYTYIPETEEVIKLYGVGPKQVNDRMFEKFFKYNSGGKCFSVVHTKHLTVTIDAFTIHNALWQGKRLPTTKTKDMALVI
ncbi:Patronin [Orchesella cincta]|uniref:Patronin n=1 Tax=Orchesella cincta TaxID=48709 RepID=A0A1D2MMB8_ORCCI|nr:Patronin [Orchesella cincta]